MATYITLVRYTDQGVRDMKNAPARIEAARNLMKDMDCKLVAYYLTLGGYDAVTIAEAPDDETVARLTLKIAGQGNVNTTTLRAFDEAEAVRIFESLG